MKSSAIRGWKEVFQFTFFQTIKSKSYLVSLLILMTISLCAMPIYSYFTIGSKSESHATTIQKVYVLDETGMPKVDFSSINSNKGLEKIVYSNSNESFDTLTELVDKKEPNSAVMRLTYDLQMGFEIEVLKSKESNITSEDLSYFSDKVYECFQKHKVDVLGLSAEQLTLINTPITSEVYQADVTGEPVVENDTSITIEDYWFIYGLLFFVMMTVIFSSSQIATSIISDKSSKVVEFLLTSVKPLAILVGKILAMLSVVLIQMLCIIVAVFISNKITASITGMTSNDVLSMLLRNDTIEHLNIFNIAVCLVVVSLSLIFFAVLAGLAGSTVSRIQEASDSLSIFTMVTLVGVYVAIGAAGTMVGAGLNGFVYFALLFPISSAFILPGAILIGKVSFIVAACAILLQIIFIIGIMMFTANVYETLILHNGNKIGIKKLFQIFKQVKGDAKNE